MRETAGPESPAPSPRLLLTDDRDFMRAGLGFVLEAKTGLVVAGEAADGEEAVSLCRDIRPDVVLMDITMPGMDETRPNRARERARLLLPRSALFYCQLGTLAPGEQATVRYVVKAPDTPGTLMNYANAFARENEPQPDNYRSIEYTKVEASASGGCTITGTEAADALVGTPGADVICGLGGNDTLRGLAGNDALRGGEGDDKLFGAGGDDSLEGEAGRDTASYVGSEAAIVASLAAGTATGEGSDTLAGVEHLVGSRFGDDFTGSDAANRISGVNGADTLRGGASNDTLVGKSGPDDLRGETGNDKLDSIDGKTGNDRLDGGTGTDACLKDATERSVTSCEG